MNDFKIRTSLEEGKYVYVEVEGTDSYQNSITQWKTIADACAKYKCMRILCFSKLTPLPVVDAFNHYDIFIQTGITPQHKIAYVDKHIDTLESDQFIEDVLINRGFHKVQLFTSLSKAKKWLLED